MDENQKKEQQNNDSNEFYIEPKNSVENITDNINQQTTNNQSNKENYYNVDIVSEISNSSNNSEPQIEIKIDDNKENTKKSDINQDNNSLEAILSNVWNEFPVQKKEKFSININTFDDVLKIIVNNEYDYVVVSPEYEKVKIIFKKEEKDIDEKFITYPIYSNILIKIKTIFNFDSDRKKPQEWKWKYKFDKRDYDLEISTIPESFWEKITIKPKLKIKTKASINEILTFTWALSFIIFIISSSFITFIVINAQNVEDVIFFSSLWISLNDINDFIWKVVNLVFSSVIFIEVILFAIFWIKFLLTKKEYKKKRLIFWSIAFFCLFLTFLSWNLWIATIKKVNGLPNWQDMSFWEIQLYDNTKLLLWDKYSKKEALIWENELWSLIWPVTIKFDLTFYAKREENNWYQIEKFTWDFWDWEMQEELTPSIIKEFNEKKTYNIKVYLELKQKGTWKITTKEVDNMPSIWIKNIVKISEKILNSWWKTITFDATDLKNMWKVDWYSEEDLKKPIITSYIFTPKPIFEDKIFWLYIKKDGKTSENLDKVFLISWVVETQVDWTINFNKTDNDLVYELSIKDIKIWLDDWYIESFKWIIWDDEKILKNEVWNEFDSSKLKYSFPDYWKHEVKMVLTDTNWRTKELKKIIDVKKETLLKNSLSISDNWTKLDVRHENWIYYIQDLPIPTRIKFDANLLKTENPNDSLKKVIWEYDWKNDDWNTLSYNIETEWKSVIKATYIFSSIKDSSEKTITETIYINSIKKEAILDLEIKPSEEEYVPVTIKFDASKSEIKDENITKFIYDYWDWTPPEERDAINPWHRYTIAWEYTIKLTVVTSNWKKYSTSKKLILKPGSQLVKIKASMKEAPIMQWIDFTSNDSEWQIVSYFWDFWDWETSTDANPTHAFKDSWTYKVTLKAEFNNKNIIDDFILVKITD